MTQSKITYKHRRYWVDHEGKPIGCKEKNKVMQENLEEFLQTAQDLLEDAILMGYQEHQVKETLVQLIESLNHDYHEP
jgi:hypothetical protein